MPNNNPNERREPQQAQPGRREDDERRNPDQERMDRDQERDGREKRQDQERP